MRRTNSTILLIILLAFALRANLLGNQELRGDEGFSWNYIQGTPATILERIVAEGDPQPPLHYWLLWGWSHLNGDSEFALRFPSIFLSLLLIPLIYQVGRKLWRAEVGLLAAFITAIQPQQIWLAQDARNMYVLALAGILGTLWLLPTVLRSGSAKYWLAYVACGVFAMYSHYYAVFALLAQAAYVIEARSTIRQTLRWLGAGATIALLVAPWALIILPIYSNGQLAQPGNLAFVNYVGHVFGEILAGPAFPQTTSIILALLFGAITLAGLIVRIPWRLYLLAGVIVPLVGIYAVVGLRSTFNAYYFVFAYWLMVCLTSAGVYGGWVSYCLSVSSQLAPSVCPTITSIRTIAARAACAQQLSISHVMLNPAILFSPIFPIQYKAIICADSTCPTTCCRFNLTPIQAM